MELKDAITGIGLVVVVAGWLFGRWKDQNHEVFKERLKRRLEMYQSVISAARDCMCLVNDKGSLPSAPKSNSPSLRETKLVTFSYAVDVGDNTLNEKLRAAHAVMNLYGTREEVLLLAQFSCAIQEGSLTETRECLDALLEKLIRKTRKELGYAKLAYRGRPSRSLTKLRVWLERRLGPSHRI